MSNRTGNKGPRKPGGLGQKPRQGKGENRPFAFESDDRPRLNQPRQHKQAQPLNDMRLGEFTIDRMSHDGRGIAQWQGKTLFIDDCLTGERVTARLVRDHARYVEARLDKLIEASPERVTPPCAHYAECGGCQLQHWQTDRQLAFKQETLLQQLARWGGVTPKRVLPAITSATQGYRRCARLGVSYLGGEVVLGFRQNNSHQLVDIRLCLVLAPSLNRLLAPLKAWLVALESAEAVTHVEMIASETGDALILRHTKMLAPADLAGLQVLAASHQVSVWLLGNDEQLRDLAGEPVNPRLHYSLPDFGVELAFHPDDFIQVNAAVNAQMVAQALQLLQLKGRERVLDLFCGIGNFTLPLARQCAEVLGIEGVESMVERGRENAARQGIGNATFMAANLLTLSEHRLRQTCGRIDAVLLDPPRDGAKEIVDKLPQLSPKRIVYVSCNPATLARDAKVLVAAGYRLDAAGVMDMFPRTAHVESMALFVRE